MTRDDGEMAEGARGEMTDAGGGRGLRTCPRCGAGLFEDMNVCYGCLYDFSKDRSRRPGDWPRHDVGEAGHAGGDCRERPSGEARAGEAESGQDPAGETARGGETVPDELWGSLDELWEERDGPGGAHAATRPRAPAGDTVSLSPLREEGPTRVLVETPSASVTYLVGGGGVSFGRGPRNDVTIRAPTVSREHLRIDLEAGRLVARDLGATNPALLNGRPISGAQELIAGDTIEFRGSGITIRPCGAART